MRGDKMSNPRKPKNQKILEGTFRKDRDPKNIPEPDKLITVPPPPNHLGKFAKQAWKILSKKLVDNGLLSELDMLSFQMLCVNIGIYRDCLSNIQKEGTSRYLGTRNSQTALELTTMNKAMAMIKQFSALFGLSPSDRAKMGILPTKEKTPEEIEEERAAHEMEVLMGGGKA
jgi:P27 family predicted phage terminase small subunit